MIMDKEGKSEIDNDKEESQDLKEKMAASVEDKEKIRENSHKLEEKLGSDNNKNKENSTAVRNITEEEIKEANKPEFQELKSDKTRNVENPKADNIKNEDHSTADINITEEEVKEENKPEFQEELETKNEENPKAVTNKENEDMKASPTEDGEHSAKDQTSYDPKNVHYEGSHAVYTDQATGSQFQWDKEKNEWLPRSNVEYGFEDDTHVYTDTDGVKYFWDKAKSAWFPKVDDDFMARYQMSYGFIDNTTKPEEVKEKEIDKPKLEPKPKGEKRKASEPTWFEVDQTQNTNVYVSNLPTSITEQEFIDFMQKCGLVMRDVQNGSYKVKLYKVPGTDIIKGDALCTYIKIESVELALKLLDGYNLDGHKIKVEIAKFQLKGQYDPSKKPKMKKRKDKLKLKKQQEKLFDWRPEKPVGERSKHEKVVIIKNLFDPNIFDQDVGLILEFQQDLREECSKIGEVRKVIIYDRHPEGVAQINMTNPEEADQVVTVLNNRWFMKRQLTAEIWDGKTKFKIAETDSEITQRLSKWDEFLEGEEKSDAVATEEKREIDTKIVNE